MPVNVAFTPAGPLYVSDVVRQLAPVPVSVRPEPEPEAKHGATAPHSSTADSKPAARKRITVPSCAAWGH
ncbi:MAG: hypothetical protein NVS3B26_11670 [Mycobacteriales bacterium]